MHSIVASFSQERCECGRQGLIDEEPQDAARRGISRSSTAAAA